MLDDSDNTKLTIGFKSITFAGLVFESSNFLFLLNITLDLVNFWACGLMHMGGGTVGALFIDGDSDSEEECEEKSLSFDDDVKSELPVIASLILLKLRVLLLLFGLTDMFWAHAPY